jgi:hypothetical protein
MLSASTCSHPGKKRASVISIPIPMERSCLCGHSELQKKLTMKGKNGFGETLTHIHHRYVLEFSRETERKRRSLDQILQGSKLEIETGFLILQY